MYIYIYITSSAGSSSGLGCGEQRHARVAGMPCIIAQSHAQHAPAPLHTQQTACEPRRATTALGRLQLLGCGIPSTAEWLALSSGSKAQRGPTWPATLFRSSWRPSSTKRRNSWQSCWLHTQRSGSMTCTPERLNDMHAGAAQ